jgi:hypothetical protein
MLVRALREQWICSCGNWVDRTFDWCPDCCEDKSSYIYDAEK